ncbi:MAG: periplasmic heavy metal sensor [Hyphomicrobiales bacterium]
MSDVSNSPAPTPGPDVGTKLHRWRNRGTAWVVMLVVAAGLTGAAATKAFSRGPGFGPGWHGGMMGGPGMMGGAFDPARAEAHADRMVRHMAIELEATDSQQEKLRAVAKAAVKDLLPMREKAQEARLKARELLTQSTVDRAQIERFRTEQIALADTFTKRVTQAVTDAAEILTPEQRRKLNDRLPPMGGPGRH